MHLTRTSNEVVTVYFGQGPSSKPVKFFRYLTLKYAPGFASAFSDPRVTEFSLENVPPFDLRYFTSWLHSCYKQDYENDNDLWHALGTSPNWRLVGCKCTKPRVCQCSEEDPLYVIEEEDFTPAWALAQACVGVFTFATIYNIVRLREDAIDRLCWYYNELRTHGLYDEDEPELNIIPDHADPILTLPAKCYEHAYANTMPGSPLRKVLVRALCNFYWRAPRPVYGPRDGIADISELPRAFLNDVADCLASGGASSVFLVDGKRFPALVPCDFHEHASEQERRDCSRPRIHFYEDSVVWLNPDAKRVQRLTGPCGMSRRIVRKILLEFGDTSDSVKAYSGGTRL